MNEKKLKQKIWDILDTPDTASTWALERLVELFKSEMAKVKKCRHKTITRYIRTNQIPQ